MEVADFTVAEAAAFMAAVDFAAVASMAAAFAVPGSLQGPWG
jgi:hypothetical protein